MSKTNRLIKFMEGKVSSLSGSCSDTGSFSLYRQPRLSFSTVNAIAGAAMASHYNVLIASKCRAGDFQCARKVFDEMRASGCDPNASSWNYLLGCLLKSGRVTEACDLIEAMETSEPDDIPNSLTYEIIACHACKAGRMDSGMRVLDQMFLEKLTPRITIHTSFIKGYLYAGRTEDALKYVSDMSTRDRHSTNKNYSLLAKLLRKSGKIVEAGRVLYELMKKGLRPDHSAYVMVAKDLHKAGRGDLAVELESLFQRFSVQSGLG